MYNMRIWGKWVNNFKTIQNKESRVEHRARWASRKYVMAHLDQFVVTLNINDLNTPYWS